MSATEPENEVQVPSRGQITTPNPLELIWERHKSKILMSVAALGIVIAGNAFRKYQIKKNRNHRWDLFAAGLKLENAYAPPDLVVPNFPGSSILGAAPQLQQAPKPNRFGVQISVYGHWTKLKQEHMRDLATRPAEELEKTILELEGESGATWALWALACKYRAEGNRVEVQRVFDRIAKIDARFPALMVFKNPPIYVPLPELPEDKKEDDKDDDRVPEAHSAISLDQFMLSNVKKDQEFKQKHPGLFAPAEPDARPVIKFETTIGNITVRLYGKKAPKHCANFIARCEAKFYDGLYFYKIQKQKKTRSGFDQSSGITALLCYLGNPKAKDEDRSTWGDSHSSEKQIDFEHSAVSHFPFMLAAERQSGNLNSDSDIIYFTGNDSAKERDEGYVVFGRIMDGADVVSKLVSAKLMTTAEEEAGLGKPKGDIRVIKVTVQK